MALRGMECVCARPCEMRVSVCDTSLLWRMVCGLLPGQPQTQLLRGDKVRDEVGKAQGSPTAARAWAPAAAATLPLLRIGPSVLGVTPR